MYCAKNAGSIAVGPFPVCLFASRSLSYTISIPLAMVERMQQSNQAWIGLFRRIPGNLQDTLSLGLTTGAEIVVQKIVKLEPDFMIIRGRLAGTLDAGRVVMLPYSQLTFVAVMRDLQEVEVEAIFGKGAPVAVADLPPSATPAAAKDKQPASDSGSEEPPPPSNRGKKPESPSKTVLLAKLRERMKDAGK
jgi:hypothetical protein